MSRYEMHNAKSCYMNSLAGTTMIVKENMWYLLTKVSCLIHSRNSPLTIDKKHIGRLMGIENIILGIGGTNKT